VIRTNPALFGIGLQLVALVLFVCMDVVFKLLTGHFAVLQLAWARFFVSTLTVWLFFWLAGRGRVPWRSRAPGLQAARSMTLTGCTLFFSSALVFLPLADTTAVNFAAPLLSVAAAAFFLKEKVSPRRWLGVALGLVGVMLAVRPPFITGEAAPHPAYLLPLGSAALFALYTILTRKLAARDDPRTTILHTGLAATLALSVAMPFVWIWPTPFEWLMLVTIGVIGGASHGLLVLAYSRAPVSVLAPLSYSQLIWAGIAGWLVFADLPDRWTLMGALVIFGGGILAVLPDRRGPSLSRDVHKTEIR
jgi:drug/metabolite transporter (DMT)-like permease